MGKIKANKIIDTRNNLSNEITKYWNIIRVENIVNKNYTRNYDLKALYDLIKQLANNRMLAKLQILCINMGISSLSNLPADCNQVNIFKLSELNEQKVQLGQIKTLNPKLKALKGKKNLNKTEALTSNWIQARIAELDLEIIEIKKKLTEFNENAELDDSKTLLTIAA